MQITDLESQVAALNEEIRVLNRSLTGMRNMVKIAAEYKNDDIEKRVDGIQAALLKAASFEPRQLPKRYTRKNRAN